MDNRRYEVVFKKRVMVTARNMSEALDIGKDLIEKNGFPIEVGSVRDNGAVDA